MPNNIDMGGFGTVGGPLMPFAAPPFATQLLNQGLQRSVSIGIRGPFSGFLTSQTPDGSIAHGNARGPNAVDWQTVRSAATQVASGITSVIGGGANNTASIDYTTIAGGLSNNALSGFSTVGGGTANSATGYQSTVCGGAGSVASGAQSVVAGGAGNTTGGVNSWCPGGGYATTRALYGGYAWASTYRSAAGDNQHIGQVVGATTTDATTTTLTANRSTVSSTNVMVLPNSSSLSGIVVGTARDSSGNCATWIRAFRVTRGANAASTTVAWDVDMVTPSLDAALSTATFVVAADTTQGAAVFRFTGVAATTIDALAEPFSLQIVR